MFAAVDFSSLMNFFSSLLPTLSFDPVVAGAGALVLFVVQSIGGHKFNFWGTVSWVLTKLAPSAPVSVPVDLAPHEATVLQKVLDAIKSARENAAQAVTDVQSQSILKDVLDKIVAK